MMALRTGMPHALGSARDTIGTAADLTVQRQLKRINLIAIGTEYARPSSSARPPS